MDAITRETLEDLSHSLGEDGSPEDQRVAACVAGALEEVDRLTRELEAARRNLEAVTNAECTCGGMGPNDYGVCGACRVWHRFKALSAPPAEAPGRGEGGKP